MSPPGKTRDPGLQKKIPRAIEKKAGARPSIDAVQHRPAEWE